MKKLNIDKETLINTAMFMGGLTLLVNSAHIKDGKVVWNALKVIPAELLIVEGLMSEGEHTHRQKVNKLGLRDSEGNVVELKRSLIFGRF